MKDNVIRVQVQHDCELDSYGNCPGTGWVARWIDPCDYNESLAYDETLHGLMQAVILCVHDLRDELDDDVFVDFQFLVRKDNDNG